MMEARTQHCNAAEDRLLLLPVHIVGGGVDAPPVPQLHLPVLDELRGQQRPGAAVSRELGDDALVERGGVLGAAVAVHETLHVEAGQQPRDEVLDCLDGEVGQHLQQLLLVPDPVTQQHAVVVDCVLVGLLGLYSSHY